MAKDVNFIPSVGDIPFVDGFSPASHPIMDSKPKTGNSIVNFNDSLKPATDDKLLDGSGVGSLGGSSGGSQPDQPYVPEWMPSWVSEGLTDHWLLWYLQQGGLSITPFVPNPDGSPSENLGALSNWLSNIFTLYDFSSGQKDSRNFGAMLQYVYSTLSHSLNSDIRDLSDSATLEIAEKITDQCFTFITAQFQSALSYQSWYLQQEYNTPLNQINRLAAAGLHSAFALGNLNSGNAQQMAGVPSVQNPQPSNAGQAEAQSGGNVFGLVGSIASSVLSFIPSIAAATGSTLKNVTDSQLAKKLLPLQAAKMGSEIATNVQHVYNMRNDVALASSNQALRTMDTLFNESKDILGTAQSEVNVADNAYKTMMIQGTSKLKELTWETKVRDKNGHVRSYTMDNDEMRDCFRNGGRTRSGDVVVGSENWSNELETKVKAGASKGTSSSSSNSNTLSSSKGSSLSDSDLLSGDGLDYVNNTTNSSSSSSSIANSILSAFNVQMNLDLAASNKYSKGGLNSSSHDESFETSYDSSSGKTKSNIGYNEDGTEFHVGSSSFKSTSREKIVTLREHFDKIQQARKYFEDSVNRYNALTKEQQTRLLYWQDMLRENIGNFSGAFCGYDYVNRLKMMYQPREIVGD